MTTLQSTNFPHSSVSSQIQVSSNISSASASAISATLSLLSAHCLSSLSGPSFALPYLTLIPSSTVSSTIEPALLTYLCTLTRAAHEAANAQACSSLLAGQASESDDFGDVGIWLGDGEFGKGHESEVLQTLGLDKLLSVHVQTNNSLFGNGITPSSDIKAFLKSIADVYSFTVDVPESGGTKAFVLLGKYRSKYWLGLLGLGTLVDDD